jgi:hypothetical protein
LSDSIQLHLLDFWRAAEKVGVGLDFGVALDVGVALDFGWRSGSPLR